MLQVKKNVVGDLRNQMMKQQVEMVMAIQSHLNPSNPISTLAPSDDVQVFQKGSQDSNSSQHSEGSSANGKVVPVENANGRNCNNPMDRNGPNHQNGQKGSDRNGRNGRDGLRQSDAEGGGRSGNKVRGSSVLHLSPSDHDMMMMMMMIRGRRLRVVDAM